MAAATGRNGNVLNYRGVRARNNLIAVMRVYFEVTPWREVSVKGITQLAKMSESNFWNYFPSLENALAATIADFYQCGEKIPEHIQMVHDLVGFEEGRTYG